jgi:polysaccharide chain length determinant protein (PEP-CTERM system associated)
MNQVIDKLYDEARSAWRYRWIGMAAAAAVAFGGWLVVFSIPDRYEASASIFVDTQTALRPVLQGLAVDQDINVQLNYVRQALLSGQRLESIARKSGVLPPTETDPRKIAAILKGLSSRVKLDVASASTQDQGRGAGSIYTFSFQDGSRDRSLTVMDTVVTTFTEETLGGKREDSADVQTFLQERLKELEERLIANESRLAEFKKQNVGLLPAEGTDYFTQLQQSIDDALRLERELQVAVAGRDELERQLRGDSELGAAPSAAGGPATDTVTLINQAQARLDELLLKYTDKYPTVVDARATLEALKVRRELEIEQLRQGDPDAVASSGVSSNPIYQNTRMQLNQARLQVANLSRQLAQSRQKANELRQRLDVVPKVAAEYADLTRQDEVLKAEYNNTLANFEKAQVGDRAANAGAVRFEPVKPVDAPYQPVFPPRALFLTGILVLALAVGGGLAWMLHMLRPVVTSVRSLTDLTDLPVLGVVSAAFPSVLAARARAQLGRFLLAGTALAAAFVVTLTLNWVGLRLPELG